MANVDLKPLIETHRGVALIDNDPGSGKNRERFIERCKEVGVPVTKLKRRAIENYFSVNALRAVYGSAVPKDLESIDSRKPMKEHLGFSPKGQNRAVARAMRLEELEATDLKDFLNAVQQIASNTS